jgi:hypothetical protein
MTSTTSNKKEIVDSLWDWAKNHGNWGKLLVSKIVISESSLFIADREIIFNYFLQSLNLGNDMLVYMKRILQNRIR